MAGDPAAMMFQAASAVNNGLSAYGNAYAQRSAARVNAALATAEAEDALARGAAQAVKAQTKAERRTASLRTQIAGRGFTVGAGTAGDIEAASDFLGMLDAATARENARREALAPTIRAANYRAQAAVIDPLQSAMGAMLGSVNLTAFRPR